MWSRINNFFTGIIDGIVRAARAFIAAALPRAKEIIIGELKDFAVKIVRELQLENLSGEEKRKAAFDRIKKYAEISASDASDSMINLVIELALQYVRGTA